jgi:hypothetical protein
MLKKLIVPAALALAVLGSSAAPVLARDRDRDRDNDHRHYRDRYETRYDNGRNDNGRYDNGRYDNGRYDNGRYDNGRYSRRDWGGERQRVADRANRLFREGRLTRDHYDRTMEKLNQRGGSDWTSQVDETLTEWSRSDHRRR